jgi:hypothetical protein
MSMSTIHQGVLPELEQELEGEYEGEEFLGSLARRAAQAVLGSLGGQSDSELETEYEFEEEGEYEGEFEEEGEEFLGGIVRGLLGEGEFEEEGEYELEAEWEGEFEAESEAMANPLRRVYPDAMMEHLGHAAAEAETEAEAEAFIGALVPLAAGLVRSAAPIIARSTPQLVRGLANVTRTLRRNPATRRFVRVLPTVLTRTTRNLARQVARGRPVTARSAVRTLAGQTARVLSDPRARGQALRRARALDRRYHRAARPGQLPVPARSAAAVRALAPRAPAYRPGYRPRPGYAYRPGYPRRRYPPALSVAWVPVPALGGGYPSPRCPC